MKTKVFSGYEESFRFIIGKECVISIGKYFDDAQRINNIEGWEMDRTKQQ